MYIKKLMKKLNFTWPSKYQAGVQIKPLYLFKVQCNSLYKTLCSPSITNCLIKNQSDKFGKFTTDHTKRMEVLLRHFQTNLTKKRCFD